MANVYPQLVQHPAVTQPVPPGISTRGVHLGAGSGQSQELVVPWIPGRAGSAGSGFPLATSAPLLPPDPGRYPQLTSRFPGEDP